MHRLLLLLPLMPLLLLTGCEAPKPLGFEIDLSQLNWQTAALIALAYLANSQGHFGALAKAVRGVLQQLRVLPPSDSKSAMTADQVAALLSDLFRRLNGHPELQAQVLQMMQTTAVNAAKAPANASE